MVYFNRLQKKMLETAAAPMVEMTKDLLEQQKVLIDLYINRVRIIYTYIYYI